MIKFDSVCKKFEGREIVKNASFFIKKNTCTALLGESGAGKTTLVRMINGLEEPTDGFVYVDGKKVNSDNIKEIRFKVGFVFQAFHLFPHLTALQNIILAPSIVLKKEKSGILSKANQLLEKFKLIGVKDQKISQLSGGQKQRIAIIRALMMDPEIVVLDEPTSALDPSMINEVGEVIDLLRSINKTVVIVTHNAGFVKKYCTDVIFCKSGFTKQFLIKDFFTSKDPDVIEYLHHDLS